MSETRESDNWSEYADHADLVKIEDARLDLDRANQHLRQTVAAARTHGVTWTKIGAMLGTTRQAAQERFSET